MERRKKIAREKILEPLAEAETEVDIEDVYKTGSGEQKGSREVVPGQAPSTGTAEQLFLLPPAPPIPGP